jgi:hypothetical protein
VIVCLFLELVPEPLRHHFSARSVSCSIVVTVDPEFGLKFTRHFSARLRWAARPVALASTLSVSVLLFLSLVGNA